MSLKEYFSLRTDLPALDLKGGVIKQNQSVFFLGVLLGALSKVAYDHFQGTTPFAWGSLVIAIIGSFATFPTIYKNAGLSRVRHLTFAKWCVAFQYGLFWQVVFKEIGKNIQH